MAESGDVLEIKENRTPDLSPATPDSELENPPLDFKRRIKIN